MKPIEDRLRETIGLDAASVGPGLIQRAVGQRMRSLGLKRLEDYQRSLEHSRAEWNELVESVVVTETWFFRDPEPIAAFVRLVREEWLPAHSTTRVALAQCPLLFRRGTLFAGDGAAGRWRAGGQVPG